MIDENTVEMVYYSGRSPFKLLPVPRWVRYTSVSRYTTDLRISLSSRGRFKAPWTANYPSRSNAGFGSDDYRLPRSIPRGEPLPGVALILLREGA